MHEASNVSVPKASNAGNGGPANAGNVSNPSSSGAMNGNAGGAGDMGGSNVANASGSNTGGANIGQNAGNVNAGGTQAGGANANMTNVSVSKANVGNMSNAGNAGAANAAQTGGAVNAAGTTGSLGTNLTTGVGKLIASPFKALGSGLSNMTQAATAAFSQGASALTGLVGTAGNAALVTVTAVGSAAVIGVGGIAVSTTDANPAIYDSLLIQEDDCSAYESSLINGGVAGDVGIGTEEQCKNAHIAYQTIYKWLSTNGYTNAENMAWGIVANIYRECSLNPGKIEGDKMSIGPTEYDKLASCHHGIGIVQWTNYKPNDNPSENWKSTKIANFFKENNMPWNTLESQLILLLSENDPAHGDMLAYLSAATSLSTPEECDIMFLTKYEKPAQEYVDQRTQEAVDDINRVKVYAGQYELTADDSTIIDTILSQAASLGDSAENLVTVQANNAAVCGNALGIYDNSSIAKAAVSFAHANKTIATSQKENESNPITALYHNICRNTIKYEPYDSCDRASIAAVCWSGSDDDFANKGGVDAQYAYLSNSSNEKWEFVGKIQFDENGYPSNCQPGDIIIATAEQLGSEHGHVIVYVGNEAIKAHFGDNPDVADDANVVQASYEDYDACCGTIKNSERNAKYSVFRCVKPDNSDTYKNAGEAQAQ